MWCPAQDVRVFVRCPRCLRLVVVLAVHSLGCDGREAQQNLDLGLR